MSLDVELSIDIETGGKEKKHVILFEANITHNLNRIAKEAGIYKELWRPEETGADCAGDIVDEVERGLELMKADPERFKAFDADNGWGTYEQFVSWVERYLAACKENPLALIWVSR